MSTRLWTIVALVLLLGGGGGYLLWRASHPALCEVCARPLHERMRYTVEMTGKGEKTTCCPRCGVRFQGTDPEAVKGVWTVDYLTGERLDGRAAVYVEGSDVHLCCSMAPLRNMQGSRYDLDWDRCLPSLVAFRTREEAEEFRRSRGGEIMAYEGILEEIRRETEPGGREP